MKKINTKISCLLAAALLGASATSQAAGNLDTFKLLPDQLDETFSLAESVPIFWDKRCANVSYTFNVGQLPNALIGGLDEISIEDTVAEVQASLNSWNHIPTSYINMNIEVVRDTGNPQRGFDFINEVTFNTAAGFTALASSPSTSLNEDTTFVAGDDIDGDGDSDVYEPKKAGGGKCQDIDGDGDIEFPAGFYKAGTILDNDVQFSESVGWSLLPGDDNLADIRAVSVHEFGHSHGLSHVSINVTSRTDGNGATMFPSIQISDGASEEAVRTPSEDDIAWSSFSYPEGSERKGIASVNRKAGDVAFDKVYSVLKGSVTAPDGTPVVGASVTAIKGFGSRAEATVEGYSGTALFRYIPATETSGAVCCFFPASPELGVGVKDGDFEIPVTKGLYRLVLQALDGTPITANQVNFDGVFATAFGTQNFPEELLSPGHLESSSEISSVIPKFVFARPGRDRSGLDFITNVETPLSSFTTLNFGGFTSLAVDNPNLVYATRFTNADVLAQLQAGQRLTSALIQSNTFVESAVPMFKRFAITTGFIDENGIARIDTKNVLRSQSNVLAQDFDDTPFYFFGQKSLSREVEKLLEADPSLDVFVIAEEMEPAEGEEPTLVALSFPGTPNNSYFAFDGSDGFQPLTLGGTPLDWGIQLRFVD